MFGRSREEMMYDQMFNIKCMIKDFNKTANRYKTEESVYLKKAKKSLSKGDERTAMTYIRQSKQYSDLALRTTTLACNLEVVEARIKESIQSGKINESISNAVSILLSQVNPRSTIMSVGVMDKAFEDIATCSNTIIGAIGDVAAPSVGTMSLEQEMLNDLKDEVAQEATLELSALPSLDKRLGILKNKNKYLLK